MIKSIKKQVLQKNIRVSALCSLIFALGACSKPDPILPGVRMPVFGASTVQQVRGEIPKNILSDSFAQINIPEPQKIYQQNLNNEIFEVSSNGEKRKIFAGFPTDAKIDTPRTPLLYKNFVYAGLTTGELIKINPKTREIAWIADIFKNTDMLGGGSVLDMPAAPVIDNGRLFAGGLGRAFCQINIANGDKKWCADISVAVPFQIAGNLAFVTSADNELYALNADTGVIYWMAKTSRVRTPRLEIDKDKYFVIVGRQHFYAESGELED